MIRVYPEVYLTGFGCISLGTPFRCHTGIHPVKTGSITPASLNYSL